MISDLDKHILKTLILDNVRGVEFAHTYGPELFEPGAQLIAKLIIGYLKAFRTSPTERTLKEWAGQGYVSYIDDIWQQLATFEYDVNEYPYDLECLKKRYSSSVLAELEGLLSKKDEADPGRTINNIKLKMQALRNIQEGKQFIQKTVKEHLPDFREAYLAGQSEDAEDVRVKTGFSAIDYATGGFRPAELFLVGGESGAGKSMLLMNIAIQMWLQNNNILKPPNEFTQGYNVIYFSLEMPYDDMYARFLARMANIPERSILDKCLTREEEDRRKIAERFIEHYPFEFDIVDVPRGVSIHEIELRFQDALLKYQPHIVIIDYLGLMHGADPDKQDWQKMGDLAGEIHEFGRVHKVIMGSALQLTDVQRGHKTEVKDKPLKVGPHRIGRSSHILHHANFYLQIETRPNEDNYPDLILHTVKNRRGPKPKDISVAKNFANAAIIDMPYNAPNKNKSVDSLDDIKPLKNDISDKLAEAMAKLNAEAMAKSKKDKDGKGS